MKKLGEFLQEEDGSFDAVHLIYILSGLVVLGLITYLTIHDKKFPDVPSGVYIIVALFISGKLIQRPLENKSVIDQAQISAMTGITPTLPTNPVSQPKQ